MDPQQRHLLESCYALCTAPGSTIAFFTAAGLPGASSPSSDSIAVAIGLSGHGLLTHSSGDIWMSLHRLTLGPETLYR